MADEGPGIITTEVAAKLLLLDSPAEVAKLAREGWFKPVAKDRWRTVEVVQGHIRYLQSISETRTTKEALALLGISKEWIYAVEREGAIKRVGKNRWRLDQLVQGYIAHLRSEDRRSTKSAAESRVRDARASMIELQVAERAGKVVETEEAISAMETMMGLVRTVFGGIAAAVTRDLHLRRAIEKAIDDAFARLAALLRAESAALRSGGKASATLAADDARRMGEGEPNLSA